MSISAEPTEDAISAKFLRDMGVPIDASIPDCAWVPRSSIVWEDGEVTGDRGTRTLTIGMKVTFTVPFQWIEVDLTIEEPEGSL